MAKDLAIVLNNGSINAAVTAALAAQKYRPIMLFAETEPQASGSRMRAAYDQQVGHFKPYREHTLAMPFLGTVTPTTNAAFAATIDPRQSSVAPLMLDLLPLIAVAVRFAVHYQAAAIFVGMRAGAQGDTLAQVTEFTQIWNELIQMPCGQPELMLEAPLLELEPWQVIDVGFQVTAPFEKTWSCLENSSEPCWACRGCRSREQAFQQAAKADPMRVVRKV